MSDDFLPNSEKRITLSTTAISSFDRSAGALTAPASMQRAQSFGIEPSDRRTWKPHLTEELRSLFETKGANIVESEVQRHVYSDVRKHFAAQYWLWETRRDDRIEKIAYAVTMLVVAVLAILVAL